MARIRSIKPEFWSSLTIANLSVHARLTFIGLWGYLDDYGRGVDDLRLIKAAIWPLDGIASLKRVGGWVDEIAGQGLICRYEVEGKHYIEVTNWTEHQRVDKPKPSTYPPKIFATDSRNGRDSSRWKGEEQGTGNGTGRGASAPVRPPGLGEHPAVVAYFDRFFLVPPISAQELIAREIKDLAKWKATIDFWHQSRYRPESIPKMIERYHEDKGQKKPAVAAALEVGGTPDWKEREAARAKLEYEKQRKEWSE